MKKKNIVMIVADQWRADSIGFLGNSTIKTPNLDQLAKEGVGFSNAYCQNPVCVPSRCSFMTGWYPHTKGYRTMRHLMDDNEPNLLKTLKEAGYFVHWGGRSDFLQVDADTNAVCSDRSDFFSEKMKKARAQKKKDVQNKPDYSHYKGVVEAANHPDVEQINHAIEWIENKQYGDDPFCIYLALSLPHPAYKIEEEWYNQIDSTAIPNPVRLNKEEWNKKPSILRGIHENQKLCHYADEQLKQIKQVYYAMGTKLDAQIGNLVHTLKEKNLYDDTMIIFFSDHGDYTGDYELTEKNQNTFEDILTRVPLVIKPAEPTKIKPRITDALVELIDVQATIMDLVDIEPSHTHFGKSLREILEGKEQHRDVVFCEGGRLEGEDHCMDAGHTPDNPYWARTTEQEKMPQHTKAMMIRDHEFKYVYRLYEDDEFYHLKDDPWEKNNIIKDERYKETILEFKHRMLRHFFETGDVVPHRRDRRF